MDCVPRGGGCVMAFEFVYLLTNPAMPEWVKVGRTNCIQRRLSDLNCTAVPLPFECYAYLRVPAEKVSRVEHSLHKLIGISFSKEKEFFRTSPATVVNYFEAIAELDSDFLLRVHPDMETKEEKTKSQATNFELLQLPVGSVLTFTRDSAVTCTVADSTNQVSCNGSVSSISGLACSLLGYNVNGYRVFMFEDETLWERRLRLEKENI